MKEETTVQRIIRYSKIVLALKLNKIQLIKAREVSLKIPVSLFNRKYYKEMIDEIDRRQLEINNQIKSLLQPLFQNIDFGYSEYGQWAFSQKEMQEGYVQLEHFVGYNNINNIPVKEYYILFLSDYQDKVHTILEGSLYLKNQVSSILLNQKDVFGEYQDINKYLFTSILNY